MICIKIKETKLINFLMRKLLLNATFNISLFLVLITGLYNSSKFSKVNLIINETVSLPISFIVGISFIGGSLTGSILTIDFKK